MSMKTIAWDVDDVLNNLMREWHRSWNERQGLVRVPYEQLTENPPHRLLGVSKQQYLRSLDAFRLSQTYQELLPQKAILNWFQKNGERYRHIAVTAVPLRAAPASAQWVMRNFGVWIRSFHCIPSKRRGERIPIYDRNKADALKRIGPVDLLIDDSREQVDAVRRAGIRALLFPRPWNSGELSVPQLLRAVEKG